MTSNRTKDSFTSHEDVNILTSHTVREQQRKINTRLEEVDLAEDKMSVTTAKAEELDKTDGTTEAVLKSQVTPKPFLKEFSSFQDSISRVLKLVTKPRALLLVAAPRQ